MHRHVETRGYPWVSFLRILSTLFTYKLPSCLDCWRGNPKTVLACLCLSRVGISRISLQQPCFFVGSGVPNQVLVFMWQGIFRLSYMPSSRESLFDRVPRNYTVTAPGYTDREDFPPLLQSTVDNVCCAWWRDTLQEWEDCVCPTEEHEPHMGMENLKRGE